MEVNGSPTSSPRPSPPTDSTSHSPSTLKRTRKVTRLRSLATRPVGAKRPLVHVDPKTGKADSPHRKKLRIYLGIVARDKMDVTYENWKQDVRKKAQAIQKKNIALYVLSRGGYEFLENKLMEEKKKKQLEEAAKFGGTDTIIDPPPPMRQHMKWKMACDSLEEQASQGSFVACGRQDVLVAAIERPEHHGRVRVAGVSVMIKQYFGLARHFAIECTLANGHHFA
ncbi:hypothetical protein HKD37_19G053659 [Glycine soja]